MEVLLIIFVFLLLVQWFRSRKSGLRLPPGPRGFPFIGSLPSLRKREEIVFTQWRQEYGELVYFNAGVQKILLLNSYRALKAAFAEQGEVFSGRVKTPYLMQLTHNSGIILTDGAVWREHRRFVLHKLRDFGFGRPLSERIIDTECENLINQFDEIVGSPIAPRTVMSQTINNVIARLTFGERTGIEDSRFKELIKHIDALSVNVTFASILPVIFPFILKISPLLRLAEKMAPFRTAFDFSHNLIRSKIEEHIKELGPDVVNMNADQARDLCDALLIEKARLEKEGIRHSFTEWQIIRDLFELFLAGTDTTSITMVWAFFFLSTNLEVQQRLQAEIDEVVGNARRPAMRDRPNLPYACAVMDEVLRCSSLARTSAPHRTLSDTKLMGYDIPANTTVMANLYLVHHDPELWERPNNFWPGHFLCEKGLYKPSPYLSAFSAGKRACLGESLARMEIFMFLTGIMQSFSVRLADPTIDEAFIATGTRGSFRRPNSHEVIFERR